MVQLGFIYRINRKPTEEKVVYLMIMSHGGWFIRKTN